ncbi:hypothetical protein [Burkholderia ubonensis]|uniref:hypothetical protein n=1 Tax=Burkholderia ubonensis TaxID=101571 RepID=UPI0012FAAED9|nr:hypothetical protein [Burkholderia ubonensis]
MENPSITAIRSVRVRRRLHFPLIVAVIGYGVVLFTTAVLNDADTYWHIAVGAWILEHGVVPHVDPFSFSMAGQPWVAHEWLSEVLMALAYRVGGWNGLVVFFGAAIATTAGLLARYLMRHMSLLAAAVTLTLGMSCVSPSLLARPHLLALPVLTSWTIGLLSAEERQSRPSLYLLLLMLLWANLHASFIFGLALVVPIALDALFRASRDRWRIARRWALFFAAALAVSLLTPHGLYGLLFPFQLTSMRHVASIGEWRPLDLPSLHPIELAFIALLYFMVSRRMWVSAPRLLILAGLLYLAYQHRRHEMLAGVVGALVLAEPIRLASRSMQEVPATHWMLQPNVAVLLTGAALVTALRFAFPISRGDGSVSPVTALAAVPAQLLATPCFNSYEFGGYLIFRHVKPFIDGRADMYGDPYMFEYLKAMRPDRATLEALLKRYQIRWALLATDSAAAELIATLPNWRRIHVDAVAVTLVRNGS